jgi:four helix bundle protein
MAKLVDNKDLLDRTLKFSKEILKLARKLPKNIVNQPLIKQLVKAGTSVGANYREACEAESSKDFIHKIRISKKEAREAKYWLKLLLETNADFEEEIISLSKEATEFVKIFSSIVSKFKKA